MNHAELVSVLHKFEGSHPKDEMKTILKDSDIIESKWYSLQACRVCTHIVLGAKTEL